MLELGPGIRGDHVSEGCQSCCYSSLELRLRYNFHKVSSPPPPAPQLLVNSSYLVLSLGKMGKVMRTVKEKAPWNDSGVMKMKASGRQLWPNIALFGLVLFLKHWLA